MFITVQLDQVVQQKLKKSDHGTIGVTSTEEEDTSSIQVTQITKDYQNKQDLIISES